MYPFGSSIKTIVIPVSVITRIMIFDVIMITVFVITTIMSVNTTFYRFIRIAFTKIKHTTINRNNFMLQL